jgi:hypothetical protein
LIVQAHDIYSGIHSDERTNQEEDASASRFEELDTIQEEGKKKEKSEEEEQERRERITSESFQGVKVKSEHSS